jgi:hypothetical protein
MSATATQKSLHSEGYQELSKFFSGITPPFTRQDVFAFNDVYRRIYPTLPPQEKRKAEWLVDMLIVSVEKPDLAKLIYGVV